MIKKVSLSALFVFLLVNLSFPVSGQKQKTVTDIDKKYLYTETGGITQSYIDYYGNGFNVPDLVTVDGKLLSRSGLEGKTVVYNFWYVACRPCIAEMPVLNKLVAKYAADSIIFVGITFDKPERVLEFLKKNEFDFSISSLSQPEIDSIKKIAYYPFTAIVTKTGKLSFALCCFAGGKNSDEKLFNLLDAQIRNALNE